MKKTILLLSMIFAVVANISAQKISISATYDGKTYTSTGEIKASTETTPRTATFSINLSGASTTETAAFQYDVNVPKGYKVDESSFGLSNGALTSDAFSATRISGNNDYDASVYRVVYGENSLGKNFNGEIGHFTVSVDKTLEGDKQVFTISNVVLANCSTKTEGKGRNKKTYLTITSVKPGEAKFTVTQPTPISATLNESSTVGITQQIKNQGALDKGIALDKEIDKVKIKRTIKANSWSTIILPFDLTAQEMRDNFTNHGAVLCEFKSFGVSNETSGGYPVNWYFYTHKYDGNIKANTPYFIKVTSKISEINLTNKIVSSSLSDNQSTDIGCTDGSVTDENEKLHFVGTYVSRDIPAKNIFLSNNQYWFSVKNAPSHTKAFRAYISGVNIDSYSDDPFSTGVSNSAKITMLVDDDPVITGISSVNESRDNKGDDRIYNLSGQYVSNNRLSLPAGVYIQNGKKFIITK